MEFLDILQRHAFLSTSIAFYDLFARTCAKVKVKSFGGLNLKVHYHFMFFSFLFRFPFHFFFLTFCCTCWPSSGLALMPQFKNPGESIILAKTFLTWSSKGWRKCFLAFFTEIFMRCRACFRLELCNHGHLGIIGKVIFYRNGAVH